MEIKTEYINPSDLSLIIILKNEVDCANFSKIFETKFQPEKINYLGGWDGIEINYKIKDQLATFDDIYGGLRIILKFPISNTTKREILKWIDSLDQNDICKKEN